MPIHLPNVFQGLHGHFYKTCCRCFRGRLIVFLGPLIVHFICYSKCMWKSKYSLLTAINIRIGNNKQIKKKKKNQSTCTLYVRNFNLIIRFASSSAKPPFPDMSLLSGTLSIISTLFMAI